MKMSVVYKIKNDYLIEIWKNELGDHNSLGPSWCEYYRNGLRYYEEFRVNGLLHKEDGAARRWIDNFGTMGETYHLNGDRYSEKEYYEARNR